MAQESVNEILNYVENRLDKSQTDLIESKEYLLTNGTRKFLINEAQKCYQLEILINFFNSIKDYIIVDGINKNDLRSFIDYRKNDIEKNLLSANFNINTTNEMVNITNIWKFQGNANILKEIEILLKKLNK